MIRLPAAIAACTWAGAFWGAAASPSGRICAVVPGVVGPAFTHPGCGTKPTAKTAPPAVCAYCWASCCTWATYQAAWL
jgi:hypothetical protein